jgi:hypothetical protein
MEIARTRLHQLGRLFLRPIGLEEPEVPPPNAAIPVVRPPHISNFVLVLNGTAQTPWATLAAKVAFASVAQLTAGR